MRLKERRVDRIISAILPILSIALYPMVLLHSFVIRKEQRPRILLVARNSVAADYLSDIEKAIGGSHIEARCVATADKFPSTSTRAQIDGVFDCESRHIFWCLLRSWDLVIFANHTFGLGLCFPGFLKKLYVNHGLHVGKINSASGEDGVYGRAKVCRPFGRPYFDMMLASSVGEMRFAESLTPELRGIVKIAGNLKVDKLLAMSESTRNSVRETLHIGREEFVIHIVSTWGDGSLMAMHGDDLIEKISKYDGDARFLVSIHPRYDVLGHGSGGRRQELLARFREAGAIPDGGNEWESFVLASDVAITDHSSITLYHAVLEHGIVLADVPASCYLEGSPFDRLKSVVHFYSDYYSFGDLMEHFDGDQATTEALGIDIGLPDPGRAEVRTLGLIEEMLSE